MPSSALVLATLCYERYIEGNPWRSLCALHWVDVCAKVIEKSPARPEIQKRCSSFDTRQQFDCPHPKSDKHTQQRGDPMESILLLAIVGKNGGGQAESIDDLRSPTIPYPPDLDHSSPGPSSRVLTELRLKNAHLSWMIRKRNLSARLEALETAYSQGLLGTWAGDATDIHIRSVREAVAEAH